MAHGVGSRDHPPECSVLHRRAAVSCGDHQTPHDLNAVNDATDGRRASSRIVTTMTISRLEPIIAVHNREELGARGRDETTVAGDGHVDGA